MHPDGSSWDTSVVEVPIKQAMMRAADEVVLLAGPDKFPGSGLARICGPDSIDVLVCREGTDAATLEAFAEAGCRVVTGMTRRVEGRAMRLTILGGGGFRVPLVYRALAPTRS